MTPSSDHSQRPLISVVIATLNVRETLPRTLASIARQTLRAHEVVVVDGGSTDGTIELLRERADEIAHWQSGPDAGIYDAWNKALPHVRGDWVYFMGADDELASDEVFDTVATALREASRRGIRVVYGQVEVVDTDGRCLRRVGRPWERTAAELRHHQMAIPHQGCFTHRSVFADHGGFDATYRIAGDYELLLRELARASALFAPVVVARMGTAGASNTLEGAYRSFREQARARRRHGLSEGTLGELVKGTVWGALVHAAPVLGERRVRRMFDAYLRLAGKPRRWTT